MSEYGTSPRPLDAYDRHPETINFLAARRARLEAAEERDAARSAITLRELYSEHKLPEMIARDRSPGTIDAYWGAVRLWEASTENPVIASITRAELMRFVRSRLEAGVSIATANKDLRQVMTILNFAGPRKAELLQRIPTVEPLEGANVHKDREFLEAGEREAMLRACRVARRPRGSKVPPPLLWRTLFALQESYGWRPSDLLHGPPEYREGVRNEAIDLAGDEIKVVLQKTRRFKRGEHGVPITEPVRVHVEACRAFLGDREGPLFPLTKRVYYSELERITAAAEIDRTATAYEWRETTNTEWHLRKLRGDLFLGHVGRDVNTRNYLAQLRVMRAQAPERDYPPEFLQVP
ncbi:MAG: hypothetical protein AAFZ07_20310 [Actinomycetota bacterium]